MSLETINTLQELSPERLKKMSVEELTLLAKEIRSRIIEVMSVNGGHLGSNLGSVELTLALHYVFSSPEDKLVWDVSHQTYTHKLVTGRSEQFSTIRKYRGLSGFSHPEESPHDLFFAGHAGAALPLALGLAKSRDQRGGGETIIPIIGDATLSSGLSFEALNNVHRGLRRFLVILNDNKMSISKNVGAVSQVLSRFLSNPTSNMFLHEVNAIVSKIPALGPTLSRQGHRFTESVKNLVSPAALFEQYHLSYVGPVDGHDLAGLIQTLQGLKETPFPVILHILTKKGCGMEEAENDPALWHGAKPFNKETYKFLPQSSSKPTFPKVFGKKVLEMAENDPEIVVVTPAMSQGSCLDELMAKYPERCIDVGIAEGFAVAFSGGIAWKPKGANGLKVICSIYSTFLQRALDNVFHDVCIQEVPVVFAIDRAGIAGADGITHNGIYDIGFLNAMPHMIICQPRSGKVLRELLDCAFDWQRPTAIRYPNLTTRDAEDEPLQKRSLGKAEILIQGSQVVILPLGHLCDLGEKVVDRLQKMGIHPTLIDPVFIKPLDEELFLKIAQDHAVWITIEEHALSSGFGSIINHFMVKNKLFGHRTLNIGIPDLFVHHGSHPELSLELGLSEEIVTEKILTFLARFTAK